MSDREEKVRRGRDGMREHLAQVDRQEGRLPNSKEIERRVAEITRRNDRRESDGGK